MATGSKPTKADTEQMRAIAGKLRTAADNLDGYTGGLQDVLANGHVDTNKWGDFTEGHGLSTEYETTGREAYSLASNYQKTLYAMATNIETFCTNYERHQTADASGFAAAQSPGGPGPGPGRARPN